LSSKLTFAFKKSAWLRDAKQKIGLGISKSVTEMAQEIINIIRPLHKVTNAANISRICLFVSTFILQNYLNEFLRNLEFLEVCS
jgi:hypothetical protein